jgi:RNA polymerase sigma-70 factor (family 1)
MIDDYNISDQDLLASMKQGEEIAFSMIYKRYWKKILAVAIYKVGEIEEAESIVQDIFYSLWKRRKTLEINGPLNNYLMVSVKYGVMKFLDQQRRDRLYKREKFMQNILDDSTQQHLDFSELKRRLEKLVDELPEIPKLIYKLNKEEGKSYKEIADNLNISEKSVDAHLFRTKKTLREKLGSFFLSFLL